jgi:hypothetical protein
LIAGLASAQDPANPSFPRRTSQKTKTGDDTPRLLDRVLMTVDNEVILLSEVEEEYAARIVARQKGLPPGQTLDLRQRMLIYQQVRLDRLRAAVQAQAAWSIQGASPERIQQIVNQELQRRTQEQIKEIGSLNRLRQEQASGLMGSSAFIRDRREREDILYNLAKQDFERRFRDRVALMITPKALRAHYKRRAPELRATAAKVLGVVRFDVPDQDDPVAPRASAGKAAAAWRESPKTGTEIGAEFGGDSRPHQRIAGSAAARLQPFIRSFVATATVGTVSEPIRFSGAFWVLKIVSETPGDTFRWDDIQVQNRLRAELVRFEYQKILMRLQRDQEKTLKIWPPLGRRPR